MLVLTKDLESILVPPPFSTEGTNNFVSFDLTKVQGSNPDEDKYAVNLDMPGTGQDKYCKVLKDNISRSKGELLLSKLAKKYSDCYNVKMIPITLVDDPIYSPYRPLRTICLPSPSDMEPEMGEVFFDLVGPISGEEETLYHVTVSSRIFGNDDCLINYSDDYYYNKEPYTFLLKTFANEVKETAYDSAYKFYINLHKDYIQSYKINGFNCLMNKEL